MTANVLQAGSHHQPVCVQHSLFWGWVCVMDLVATGACCDASPSIPPAQGTSLTKAHRRWHHCHGGLDKQGNLQGTGCRSVSFLLRVRHDGLPTNIVDAFPAFVRKVLGFENFGACLESDSVRLKNSARCGLRCRASPGMDDAWAMSVTRRYRCPASTMPGRCPTSFGINDRHIRCPGIDAQWCRSSGDAWRCRRSLRTGDQHRCCRMVVSALISCLFRFLDLGSGC